MDPKAALTSALRLFLAGDISTAADRLGGYQEWRRKGGLEPTLDLDDDDYKGIGVEKHLCCADHVAMWLFLQIKNECAQHGIVFECLTPAVLDRIDDVLGD